MTEPNIKTFGAEIHILNQIHYHRFVKKTIEDTISGVMNYFESWGAKKIKRIVLTPKSDT